MSVHSAVNIGIMRFPERLHAMTANAKGGVGCGGDAFVGDQPGKKGQDHQGDKGNQYDEEDAGNFVFRKQFCSWHGQTPLAVCFVDSGFSPYGLGSLDNG